MNLALWVVQVLLACLFLFGGVVELIMPIEEMTKQVALGALGLVLPGLLRIRPGLTPLAAAGLVIIMIGATIVTLVTGGGAMALMPLVTGLLAAFVAHGRWRVAAPGRRTGGRAAHTC